MIVYSHQYSQKALRANAYYPSAPVAQITVCHVKRENRKATITALIDSGSDATMIPINILQAVGAKYVETRQVRGLCCSPVDTYLVKIHLGAHSIYGIEAAAVEPDEETIIGRDVLNQLVVILNGLAEMVEVEQ